jgi:hypothetical protein
VVLLCEKMGKIKQHVVAAYCKKVYVRQVCSYSPWFAPWVSVPRIGGWSPRWQSSRPPSGRSGSAGLTQSEQLTRLKKGETA